MENINININYHPDMRELLIAIKDGTYTKQEVDFIAHEIVQEHTKYMGKLNDSWRKRMVNATRSNNVFDTLNSLKRSKDYSS